MIEIRKTFQFEAAHRLPHLPSSHKCSRIHGHSFKFEVAITGDIDQQKGWVLDFGEINRKVEPVVEEIDHRFLNEIQGLENPTSENIAIWLWNKLEPNLPGLVEIAVCESANSRCVYRGPSR